MNEFERKLSELPFRAPPPEMREAIFGRTDVPNHMTEPARWTWREWFWPAPEAWAGLAAIWIMYLALSLAYQPAPGAAAVARIEPSELTRTLLSYHLATNLNHALELAN